ncbi:MAG: rhodanese-like domain-containing protein [Verrucomicrobiales bacterium]|jgi:rhodanese-related sulfurtransferase|nr:rhodanese-like domain-containing protein [Verrucomicrobiales bacterium]
MKRKLLIGLAAFALISVGWHVFEGIWDRSLFPKDSTELHSENIGVRELRKLLEENPDLQLVDVRPRGSYESAHLAGAVHAPFRGGELTIMDPAALDPEKPVLVYCDGGYRSRTAIPAFKAAGFQEIYHLHRGILSWRLRGGDYETGDGN